jgi:hypothetical protein
MNDGIVNARIAATTLGREDHGIFTASISLDYGSSSQSFGGYALDGKPARTPGSHRPGTRYGLEFIIRLLRALEVESWEKLKGTHCRVSIEGGKAMKIGHLLQDQWFDPKALYDEVGAGQ